MHKGAYRAIHCSGWPCREHAIANIFASWIEIGIKSRGRVDRHGENHVLRGQGLRAIWIVQRGRVIPHNAKPANSLVCKELCMAALASNATTIPNISMNPIGNNRWDSIIGPGG
jgi:hypothetical protein